MLTAFYDLAVSPAKYDFIGFLMDAERQRRLTGQDSIRFVFVPGPDNGFRKDTLPPREPEKRLMMLRNILFPMCGMLGVPTEVIHCTAREEATLLQHGEIFPTEYFVDGPTSHYGMQTITRNFARRFYPLRTPSPIKKQDDLITITLRESHYWPTRNGNRDVWLMAAAMIRHSGLKVLFIPDVDSEPVNGWECDLAASIDLHRRAAIYESAAHNFFVSNGPAWMAAAMEKPSCTIFKVIADNAASCSESFYRKIGFPVGSQIGRSNHRIVWEDDTQEAVLPVVDRIINSMG